MEESVDAKIARIDTNVKMLLSSLPMVQRHDRELFVIKVVLGVISPIAAFWFAHKLGIQIF